MRRLLPLAMLTFTASVPARGDGMLDPFFGSGGLVTANFTTFSPDVVRDLMIDASGRIVASGVTAPGLSLSHMAVARYQTSGALDLTFGIGGKTTVHFNPVRSSGVRTVLPQPSGRMLLVGSVEASVALVRLNVDGSEDVTYGTNGRVELPVTGLANVLAASLQPDGRVVVYFSAGPGVDWKPIVLRFNADGSIDTTFGSGGQTSIAIPEFMLSVRGGLALLPDGRILGSGLSGTISTPSVPLLFRLLPDGTPDPALDGDGVLLPGWGGVATAVAPLGDGRFVVAGDRFVPPASRDLVVARLFADGTPDPTFGTGGLAVVDAGGLERAVDLAALPNGKLLVLANADGDFLSTRLTDGGVLDTSYGSGGFLRTSFTTGATDEPETLVVRTPGRFYAAGSTQPTGGQDEDFAVAAYTAVVPVELLSFEVR